MKKAITLISIIVLILGCGGGQETSTTKTAQGAAKLWLEAATTGDLTRVKELTADDYAETALKVVQIIRDDGFTTEHVLWAAGGERSGTKEWSAATGPRIVTLRLVDAGTGDWHVVDASTSW